MDLFIYAFLVPLFPALGFVVLGLGGDRLGKIHGWLAVGFEGAALAAGVILAAAEMGDTSTIYHDTSFVWLYLPNGTNFVMGTMVSPLGGLMLLVVNIVGFLVVLYSNEYMAHEDGLPRYYAELMLFLTAMNALVLADNYLEFILFWELVGLCSYLLIGFFYKKPEAAAAAKKAFLVTRIGDVMFFLGVFIFFSSFATAHAPAGSLGGFTGYPGTTCSPGQGGPTPSWSCAGFTFTVPNSNSNVAFLPSGTLGNSWLATLGGIMILGGAVGKSAQFPLHTWLPDAMEGPTTVSALIHAATMVAAGIYLLAITAIFIGFTATAASVILGIGAFTSLFAGTMGLVAPDIKRVIAYSTISQLGYMAMGVGAGALVFDLSPASAVVPDVGAAMFHLFTHAFFKALLFLCAGAVIHAVGTQDIFKMGGLRRSMPLTATAMLVGALALSGIPPFAGFFSKDDLLSLTLSAAQLPGQAWVYGFLALALVGVFLTALYIFRLWFLVFGGEKSRDLPGASDHGSTSPAHGAGPSPIPSSATSSPSSHGAHDPSWIMSVPLVVLAALACAAGFLPLLPGLGALFPGFSWSVLGLVHTSSGWSFAFSDDVLLGLASLALAASGILVAWNVWGDGKVYTFPADSGLRSLHTVLRRKYYMDEAYDFFGEKVILGLSRGMDWVDRYVIDGTVRGIEETFSQVSKTGRRLQTGIVSSYAAWIAVGLLAILVFFLYFIPWFTGGGG